MPKDYPMVPVSVDGTYDRSNVSHLLKSSQLKPSLVQRNFFPKTSFLGLWKNAGLRKSTVYALFLTALMGCQWLETREEAGSPSSTIQGTGHSTGELSSTWGSPANSGEILTEPLAAAEAEFWSQTISKDRSLELPFPVDPVRDAQGIQVGAHFSAVWKFNSDMDKQLQQWAEILNKTEDCLRLGKRLGRDLSHFDECLKAARPEDRQIMMAQRIYSRIYVRLARTQPGNDQRLAFRGIVDGQGRLQAIFFADKHPDLETYRHKYSSVIPPNARQIPAIEVHHLLVAPWNLLSDHPYKVSGAGTAALSFAALESQRTPYKGRLLLESVPTAIKFYEKSGFKAFGKAFEESLHAYMPVMLLSEQGARQLVEKNAVAGDVLCGKEI